MFEILTRYLEHEQAKEFKIIILPFYMAPVVGYLGANLPIEQNQERQFAPMNYSTYS